ncbi:MAG: cytochrome c biogenesis protein CcsA [Hyphomicrobiales bacterium]|nr:cytochrome c biogenesis protein CcsA [Hyphomicrobiales bacterium]
MAQLIVLAGFGASLAIVWPGRHRQQLVLTALACFTIATVWLAARFIADDFSYRQVWLQSDPNLAWWLKLAGLWSGDEGTLLLLALIASAMTHRLLRHGIAAGVGAAAVTGVFAAGALIWSPFAATSAGELAQAPYRGMNAHLTSVWMLVHPPLVFASYLLLIAPLGAMAAAIARGGEAWRYLSARYARAGWLLVSAGIGFGMWWAYEDFTYGTLWHWDPVQTAVFAAWCYLTAMLHMQSRYRPDGDFAVMHPLLGLMTAASAMTAMAVTRSEQLASSHRYVGETSLVLLAAMAAAIVLVAVLSIGWRIAAGVRCTGGRAKVPVMLWIAALGLALSGAVAHVHLATAFWSGQLGLPRPEDLKPFFETLRNFTSAGELAALREAFAQWDVDNFGLNRWLVPVLFMIGTAGGHFILPASRKWRWSATLVTLLLATALSLWIQPFERLFDGRGLTSGKTVALFTELDALLAALGYLLAAAVSVVIVRLRDGQSVMSIPSAAIHVGVVMALFGGLSSTIFDSYSQRLIDLPQAVGQTQTFAGGYNVTIGSIASGQARDGGRATGPAGAFQTIGEVSWSLQQDGQQIDGGRGHTVYRDSRVATAGGTGAVRLMCEAVDYRFARYRSGDGQMIHPLISRGLLRDVQVWLPAAIPGGLKSKTKMQVPVVLKIYPLISLVWAGLIVCIAGAAWQTLSQIKKSRRPTSAS